MLGIGYLWVQKTVLKTLVDTGKEKKVPVKIQDTKSHIAGIIKIIFFFGICIR